MGIIGDFLSNASEINVADLEKNLAGILIDGEQIEKAYRVLRDLFVFTNLRVILVDRQGLTGQKVEYHSIPYRCITQFAVETAGTFDDDAELKIWISRVDLPITKEFRRGTDIVGIQKTLAKYVLR